MAEKPITTIQSALDWARRVLSETSETAALEARILLGEVMGVEQKYLILYPQRALTVDQAARFNQWVAERAAGRPLAYLLGRQPFYDIEVMVTPDVLIPRPETELLVERAIEWAGMRHAFIVDVGAGSGIIALALAKHLPTSHITGIEVSEAALAVARRNGELLGLERRVRWLRGNLLEPIVAAGEQMNLIVANLPYIATAELQELEVSRHEPIVALDGGEDGLTPIRNFLQDAPKVLKPDGLLLMEVGASQGAAVRALVQAAFPERTVTVSADLAGHDRIVSVSTSA